MLPPGLEPHRQAIAATLRELERALERLVLALVHDEVDARLEGGLRGGRARHRAAEAYAAIDYASDDLPNESPVCLGVLAVPRHVIRLAEQVNAAKHQLKAACAPLHGRKVRVPVRSTGGAARTEAIPAARAILRTLQRADLNLLAAYRRIPILEHRPAQIAFTRARTRSVYRVSRADLLDRLETSADPRAVEDRARVRACRDRWFALVKERYANVRANVRYEGLDARGRGRVQVAAELPLLYASGRGAQEPEIRWPPAEVGFRREREGRLEDEPYLAALTVYRYRRAD
jgi:hypothetical protein